MKPERNSIGEVMATNFTLKNIPEDLYQKVKESADRNQRSVNGEIISILAAAIESPSVSPSMPILARARVLRGRTRGLLTDELLDRAKREGRA
jgi:antitoxin FitA